MKVLLTLTTLFAFAGSALAETSSDVAFDAATRAKLKTANVQAGMEKAKKFKCAKCHEDDGVGEDDVPTLAGQLSTYNYKQLMDFSNGKRDGDMPKQLKKAKKKGMTEQDMIDMVAWYETLPHVPSAEVGGKVVEDLVYKGDPKRNLKPCGTCHGRSGQGGKYDAARLTGMPEEAFVISMEEFQEEDRTNDIYSRMRLIAKVLTKEEIELLSKFYAPVPEKDE